MSDEFSKVEVITGVARRGRFSTRKRSSIGAWTLARVLLGQPQSKRTLSLFDQEGRARAESCSTAPMAWPSA
jgi:hypothetical protein